MIDFDGRRVDPEFYLELGAAIVLMAHRDAGRSPEAREFMEAVERRCMAECGGSRISGADVAHAALTVIWQRRGEAA